MRLSRGFANSSRACASFPTTGRWVSPVSGLFCSCVQLTCSQLRRQLTPQLAEDFGAKNKGVLVSSINSGSPAEKAGLKAGRRDYVNQR